MCVCVALSWFKKSGSLNHHHHHQHDINDLLVVAGASTRHQQEHQNRKPSTTQSTSITSSSSPVPPSSTPSWQRLQELAQSATACSHFCATSRRWIGMDKPFRSMPSDAKQVHRHRARVNSTTLPSEKLLSVTKTKSGALQSRSGLRLHTPGTCSGDAGQVLSPHRRPEGLAKHPGYAGSVQRLKAGLKMLLPGTCQFYGATAAVANRRPVVCVCVPAVRRSC